MPKCKHCGTELEEKNSSKSGTYYECPKCKCTFKMCLIRFDTKCYSKIHKQEIKEIVREEKKEKKHRERPRKNETEANENE